MAFSTPATETAGTVLTASYLNTYVRDNVAWMATDSPTCRAYHNVAQSIPNTTDTAVSLNSERFDNAAMHSTSTNTSRITIPTGGGGKYLFGGLGEYAANTGAGRGLHIKLNGATFIAKMILNASVGAGDPSELTVTSSYAMSAADYVEMYAYQSSGGALNLNSVSAYSPEFWAYWLRT